MPSSSSSFAGAASGASSTLSPNAAPYTLLARQGRAPPGRLQDGNFLSSSPVPNHSSLVPTKLCLLDGNFFPRLVALAHVFSRNPITLLFCHVDLVRWRSRRILTLWFLHFTKVRIGWPKVEAALSGTTHSTHYQRNYVCSVVLTSPFQLSAT